MSSLLPFHGPLHWLLTALSYAGLYLVLMMAQVRRISLGALQAGHVPAAPGAVPETALAAFGSQGLAEAGFRPLGILTLSEHKGLYALAAVWVDAATSSTIVQTLFVQRKAASRPQVSTLVLTSLGDRAEPRTVGVSSVSTSMTSGHRPGDSAIFLADQTPVQLVAAHRLQLAQEPADAVRLPCASFGQAAAILDWLSARSLQWRLETGRLERRPDGTLRLSWRQVGWCVLTQVGPGKALRRRRLNRLGRRRLATWQARLPAAPRPAVHR